MIKKTIKYIDFDGVEIEEDLYFNLSTPEVTKLQAEFNGDFAGYAKKLAKSGDTKAMIDFIERLVLSSYGERSEDGKRFMKTKDIREKFEYSIAYAELFELLLTDSKEAEAFGKGLVQQKGNIKGAVPNVKK